MSALGLSNSPLHIVVCIYPDVMAMDVCGPMEAFAMANSLAGGALYHLSTAAVTMDPIKTSAGFCILPNRVLTELEDLPIDTLLVAGGYGHVTASRDKMMTNWLRETAPRARRHGSICTGAFLLAASNLLDGKRATTHWALASTFAREYPSTTLDIDSIFVRDGQTYTSAGISAGIDLALALIEEDHGRTFALRVARSLVVFLKRPGGQSQFSAHLQAQFSSIPAVRMAQEWALAHLSEDLSARALAARVGMSERNFRRLFVAELQETPREYVERIRLDEARRQIEDTSVSAQTVAKRCGFGTMNNLRRAFIRRFGVTPQWYRTHFQA
ncbi:GlxA family transcriptional regulator [Bradyrhizobium sp. INPA01-394B]|uniref:GlxA family transcriptional regulator n=1 Tax=Bradyrhizobium campsiandrae TaxID=1729892 RepID=A0ABR7UCB8_9BRAD|nr:GlxA family transcriptional regulator [Bradyrhizobium campsiandrae]MBC9878906.1 GlxA family transcriptional regulator [Bradyrhizobium campsiandrae]MBC9980833.1 GlxA family transcriptional regulator [Bradyrhizobium campsiandrae]